MTDHLIVGRAIFSGPSSPGQYIPATPPSAVFCECGLVFYGVNEDTAFARWAEHKSEPQISFDQVLEMMPSKGARIVLSCSRPVSLQEWEHLRARWEEKFPDNPLVLLEQLRIESVISPTEG